MSDERAADVPGGPLGPPSDDVHQRVLNAIRSVPSAMDGALNGPIPEPAAGQLWRARWEDTTSAVILLTTPEHGSVSVAAVTFDDVLADDSATVLPPVATTTAIACVVWLSDLRELPIAVLDRYMGALRNDVGSDAGSTTNAQALVSTLRTRGDQGPAEFSSGAPAMRGSVIDDLERLAQASWAPEPAAADLSAVLSSAKPSAIARALGIPTSEALRLKRGDRSVEPAEREKLAELTGSTAAEVTAAGVALPSLVIELFNDPRVRADVVSLAARRGQDETTVRRQAAYETASAAARATGNKQSEDAQREVWRKRIEQYFNVHLHREAGL